MYYLAYVSKDDCCRAEGSAGGVCIYSEQDRPLLVEGGRPRPILALVTYLLYVVGSRGQGYINHSKEERAKKTPG